MPKESNLKTKRDNVFTDMGYICKVTELINKFLKKGLDVVQLPNGDVLVSETQVVNIYYKWNPKKQVMERTTKSFITD